MSMRTVSKTKKADSSVNNSGVEAAILNQRKKEKKLHPLRINSRITLLVPKAKCNEKYAQWYRENRLEHGAGE